MARKAGGALLEGGPLGRLRGEGGPTGRFGLPVGSFQGHWGWEGAAPEEGVTSEGRGVCSRLPRAQKTPGRTALWQAGPCAPTGRARGHPPDLAGCSVPNWLRASGGGRRGPPGALGALGTCFPGTPQPCHGCILISSATGLCRGRCCASPGERVGGTLDHSAPGFSARVSRGGSIPKCALLCWAVGQPRAPKPKSQDNILAQPGSQELPPEALLTCLPRTHL